MALPPWQSIIYTLNCYGKVVLLTIYFFVSSPSIFYLLRRPESAFLWLSEGDMWAENLSLVKVFYNSHNDVFLQVFVGNSDADTVVKHRLAPPIKARYIRLTATAWNGHISMRMELYGCLGNWPFNPTQEWLIFTYLHLHPWGKGFRTYERVY